MLFNTYIKLDLSVRAERTCIVRVQGAEDKSVPKRGAVTDG